MVRKLALTQREACITVVGGVGAGPGETPGPVPASWVTQPLQALCPLISKRGPGPCLVTVLLPSSNSPSLLQEVAGVALQMALNPCVRVNHKQVCLGLSVGEDTGASSGPGGITTGTRGSDGLPSPSLLPALCPPESSCTAHCYHCARHPPPPATHTHL